MKAPVTFNTIYKVEYLCTDLPLAIMNMLREEVKEIQDNNFNNKNLPANSFLAGVIEHEYFLKKSANTLLYYLNNHILPQYYQHHGNDILAKTPFVYASNSLWVNFQKKHEYNPNHRHTGELSFVIWMNVPYDIKDEDNIDSLKSKSLPGYPSPPKIGSRFYFHTTSDAGIISKSIPVDKTYEGKIIIFPSNLMHSVTPFYTSDDYRISIAGNLTPNYV